MAFRKYVSGVPVIAQRTITGTYNRVLSNTAGFGAVNAWLNSLPAQGQGRGDAIRNICKSVAIQAETGAHVLTLNVKRNSLTSQATPEPIVLRN